LVDHHRAGPHPRRQDRIELGGVEPGERPPDRRLRGSTTTPDTQRCKEIHVGVSHPLPDRGERPGTGYDRRDPNREDPGQVVSDPSSAARVRHRGQQFQQHRRG
jgi:hypothetical protein